MGGLAGLISFVVLCALVQKIGCEEEQEVCNAKEGGKTKTGSSLFSHHCNTISCEKEASERNEVKLEYLQEEAFFESKPLFFIESSGRNYLLPRQVCAIESALRNAQINPIVVVMTSKTLDLSASNATCQLYLHYSMSNQVF